MVFLVKSFRQYVGMKNESNWLCGSLVCLDAHLPRPGWSGEDLGLITGQGTLTALRTVEGGGKWKEREENGKRWKFLINK